MSTIGTCSKCGGPVTVPDMWGGPHPAVPKCEGCGARAKNSYGPVIPMEGSTTIYPSKLPTSLD